MIRSFIALGSNLGQPRLQLQSALRALQALEHTRLVRCSPAYRSKAIGPGEQPDYLNAVVEIETGLDPGRLLSLLQDIETQQGRVRGERWGARTLDLDILLFGEEVIDRPELQIPHPRLQERAFVLYPLFDLDPGLALPCGTTLGSLLPRCPSDELEPMGDLSEPD